MGNLVFKSLQQNGENRRTQREFHMDITYVKNLQMNILIFFGTLF